MATVDMTAGTVVHGSRNGNTSTMYLIQKELDFAAAATAKGSALAASDVIQVLDVPAGSLVWAAGFEVTSVHTGTSTDTAFDFGITGGNVDAFVDGFDFDGASVGDLSAIAAGTQADGPVLVSTNDTIDVLIQAMTGTTTGGKIRCWALISDIAGDVNVGPGVAAPGS